MNQGHFAGNIGRNAETKTVGENTVTNFSLAVNTGYGDRKSALWVACAMWGSRGEKLAQYLTSGTKVAVSGDVDVRAYKSKEGEPKAEITCNVQRITLQGGGEKRDQDPPQTLAEKSRGTAPSVDPEFDDDVPFN